MLCLHFSNMENTISNRQLSKIPSFQFSFHYLFPFSLSAGVITLENQKRKDLEIQNIPQKESPYGD